jgi:hypothetical protein
MECTAEYALFIEQCTVQHIVQGQESALDIKAQMAGPFITVQSLYDGAC